MSYLSEAFDVTKFGADPTGTNYSDTAIAAALAAAAATNSRFKLRFPAGTYKVQTAFAGAIGSQSAGFSIEGDGSGASVIRWDSSFSGVGISITLDSTQNQPPLCSPWLIRGLTFVTQASAAGTALEVIGPDSAPNTGDSHTGIMDDLLIWNDSSGGSWAQAAKLTNPYQLTVCSCYVAAENGFYFSISGSNSLNNFFSVDKCYFVCDGNCLDFEGSSSGWQTVIISDCNLISVGSGNCIKGVMGEAAGGAEDWIIRDSYFRADSSGYAQIDLSESSTNFANSWIHDCFFEYTSGNNQGKIKLRMAVNFNIHDNFFNGPQAPDSAAGIGLDLDSCYQIVVRNNQFVNHTYAYTLGSGAQVTDCRNNSYVNPLSNIAATFTDYGTNNLTDQPVTYAKLPSPSAWQVGTKAFITDANTVAFTGVVSSGGGSASIPVYTDGTNWRAG